MQGGAKRPPNVATEANTGTQWRPEDVIDDSTIAHLPRKSEEGSRLHSHGSFICYGH